MGQQFWFEPVSKDPILDLILALDLWDSGFAGWLMRLPDEHRQVAFAVLSKVGAEFLRPSFVYQQPARILDERFVDLVPVVKDMQRLRARSSSGEVSGSLICVDG